MGVELMSPLLYDLVRCHRPRIVMEVGAGYSTLFLLQALADSRRDFLAERELIQGRPRGDMVSGLRRLIEGRHPLPLGLPDYYAQEYRPRLIVIDDLSHAATSAGAVEHSAMSLGLSEFLSFRSGDFRGMSKKLATEDLPIDLLWFDCGGFDHYRAVISEYWELVNPRGGLLLLHSTVTNVELRAILLSLKLKQATEAFRKFELLSILEPHKWRQNSVTMIRMIREDEDEFYSSGP
jgi:hypothetical protein